LEVVESFSDVIYEATYKKGKKKKTKHKLQLESGQHPKKAKQGSHPDFSDDKR
jgi:hypothetical protein